MSTTTLVLEVRDQDDDTYTVGGVAMLTPRIDEDYWMFRVRLSDTQAVVGFPKFLTIGIGYQVEDADWNTNLPYTCTAEAIRSHIAVNKGDDSIKDADVVTAIEMIQAAAREYQGR